MSDATLGGRPKDATGIVVLLDGLRISWKVRAGKPGEPALDYRYFTAGSVQHEPRECQIVQYLARSMDEAEAWCASFWAHPAEGGFVPETLGEFA